MNRCALSTTGDQPVDPLIPGVVTALTLTGAFGLLALGVESFWVVFVVGFGGVLPVLIGVAKHAERDSGSESFRDEDSDSALDQLRQRYARGELTDAEFERRLERLLETESSPDVGSHGGDGGSEDDPV